MEKKGILIVSFGTSYSDTELKCIKPIENAAEKLFRDFEVRRAFTSKIIIKKLAGRGILIPTPEEAVSKMAAEGFTHLIVQPLHFMKGHEYHKKIVNPLSAYRERFDGFSIGEPLLSRESDFDVMVDVVKELSLSVDGERLIFMGHGTDHSSDSVYSSLQQKLDFAGIKAKIATVEGEITLDSILPDVLESRTKTVHLFPLMLVAGDHARNDMAGENESWKTILESNGLKVIPHLKGMGEIMKIRQVFIKHIRTCKKKLFPEKYHRMRENAKGKKIAIPREDIPWFPSVDSFLCYGCGLCFLFCHRSVYLFDESVKRVLVKNPYNCVVNCSHCTTLCSAGAITFKGSRYRKNSKVFH